MNHRASTSRDEHPALTPATGGHEVDQLRHTCWRMSHELQCLRDTIEVLRAGANSLALENAIIRVENEQLRTSLHGAEATRG